MLPMVSCWVLKSILWMSYFSCSIRFFFSFHFFGSFSKINFKFFLAIKLYRINKQQHIFNQYAHDIDSAELWVAGMNAAATKLKIPIQYCMTLPVPPFNIALLGRYSVLSRMSSTIDFLELRSVQTDTLCANHVLGFYHAVGKIFSRDQCARNRGTPCSRRGTS